MKNVRKLLAVLLAGCMVFGLVACSSEGNNSGDEKEPVATKAAEATQKAEPTDKAEPTKNAGDFTIGYSYPTKNNEFWGNSLTYVEQAASEVGFKVTSDDCNNDQAEQIRDVESMISSGIDALVLGPQDASVCAGIVASCKDAGIPIVIIDRWPGDDLKAGEDYECFIGPDDEVAGYNIAMSLINGGAKKIVGIGGFQGTSVAEGRKAGLDKALKENPDVELLQFEYAGENWDDGDKAFRNIYQSHPEVDGVWCYNDSLALATVNVLKEEGKIADVKVGGMDLLNPAVESMQAGELWMSTGGHYLQAAFGAIVAFDSANGVDYDGEDVVRLKLLEVSQDNLDEFKTKFLSGSSPIDWKNASKVMNPDAKYDFTISLK